MISPACSLECFLNNGFLTGLWAHDAYQNTYLLIMVKKLNVKDLCPTFSPDDLSYR